MNPFETYKGSYFGREKLFVLPENLQEMYQEILQRDPFQSEPWNQPNLLTKVIGNELWSTAWLLH